MAVKRRTISLAVSGNLLTAADENGRPTNDAGVQGEDGAVWLSAAVPDDWNGLNVRLQVMSESGTCDESGLPSAGVIEMPLRQAVTLPGRLYVTMTGCAADGVRRTAQCVLNIAPVSCPADPIAEIYPLAFENLCRNVEKNTVREITGSGGANVLKTADGVYNIEVAGAGGDMLMQNYAAGGGAANPNRVDHAAYADDAAKAESAATAEAGSALETALAGKQPALTAGGDGTDILCGNTVRSLKGSGINITGDRNSVSLSLAGGLATTGAIAFFAQDELPDGWLFADGREAAIADYPALFAAIGTKFGTGTVTGVEISPVCLKDNLTSQTDIAVKKYAQGIQSKDYFAQNGIAFTGSLVLSQGGVYTVYCKDANGGEAVQLVNVPDFSAPYYVSVTGGPISDEGKVTALCSAAPDNSGINLIKLAAGVQNTVYFASNGLSIGSSDSATYDFQSGTAMPGGTYTFYTKDSSGRETVQYFIANTSETFSVSLSLSRHSDGFVLPNLAGTLDSLLCPCVKI